MLLLIIPIIYILSWLYATHHILKNKYDAIFSYIIIGLPVYITSLSIIHLNGLDLIIPFIQYSKELITVLTLLLIVLKFNELPRFNNLDKLVFAFFLYNALYIILPLGSYGLLEKIISFKNISYFPILYFIGRYIQQSSIWLSKYEKIILTISIAAVILLLIEVINGTHFQTITGYSKYNFKYLGVEPAGNYGLTWTFEIEGGLKRFASFFTNPLEFAAATIITISIIIANFRHIQDDRIFQLGIVAAILSIVFALSRASIGSFILVLYLYFTITKNKNILKIFHIGIIIMIIAIIYIISEYSVSEFIINTFNFTNSSSLSHLIEWVDGIQSISSNPLGIGLGESGRIAGELGLNTGGENQIIITGVQTGLISVGLYIAMLITSIKWSSRLFLKTEGKSKKIGIIVFILKTGMIIPMLTAAVESYLYFSYFGWIMTGLMSTTYNDNYKKHHENN